MCVEYYVSQNHLYYYNTATKLVSKVASVVPQNDNSLFLDAPEGLCSEFLLAVVSEIYLLFNDRFPRLRKANSCRNIFSVAPGRRLLLDTIVKCE